MDHGRGSRPEVRVCEGTKDMITCSLEIRGLDTDDSDMMIGEAIRLALEELFAEEYQQSVRVKVLNFLGD